jgi:hypothetical protein
MFLSGVVLSFRGIMASANNDKEKTPSEDDHQDLKLKEEVESEAEEEEIEEDQRPCTRSVVASIGVVTNPNQFKRSAWISTGGGVPRHTLAPQTSADANRRPCAWCLTSQLGTPRGRYDVCSSKFSLNYETKVYRTGEVRQTTEGVCGTCTHTNKYFAPNLQ